MLYLQNVTPTSKSEAACSHNCSNSDWKNFGSACSERLHSAAKTQHTVLQLIKPMLQLAEVDNIGAAAVIVADPTRGSSYTAKSLQQPHHQGLPTGYNYYKHHEHCCSRTDTNLTQLQLTSYRPNKCPTALAVCCIADSSIAAAAHCIDSWAYHLIVLYQVLLQQAP
jgi:hypothetical protein